MKKFLFVLLATYSFITNCSTSSASSSITTVRCPIPVRAADILKMQQQLSDQASKIATLTKQVEQLTRRTSAKDIALPLNKISIEHRLWALEKKEEASHKTIQDLARENSQLKSIISTIQTQETINKEDSFTSPQSRKRDISLTSPTTSPSSDEEFCGLPVLKRR